MRYRALSSLQRGGLAGAIALGILAGCDMPQPVAAPPRPAPPPADAAAPVPSQASQAVAAHFARQEASLLARGMLRTDGGGPDTPFTAAMLAENFVRIALFDEYTEVRGRLVSGPTPSSLRRWEAPVRMRLEFGASVAQATRQGDRRDVAGYTARLARLTGHPVSLLPAAAGPEQANFHILVLDEDERRTAEDRLRRLLPGIDATSVRIITDMPLGVSCLVMAFAPAGSHVYSRAVAIVRAELPDLSRLSCYHEELAQGLGLPNDSPRARPSLFNDNEEFALLTRHDELLLRILYDPRLRPGMREAEARPIVLRLAKELMPGEG